MLKLLQKYKTVVRFILTFLGSYFVLFFLYQLYLDYYFSRGMPDIVTKQVALQTEVFVNSLGYDAFVAPSSMYPLMNLSINDVFIARIIEGCNSISLVILFLAFMFSFIGKLKPTLIFILAGSAVIYGMNITRIALLSVAIYEMPEKAYFFHEIVFPLVIYGTVFALWIIWIYLYTKTARK